MNKEIEIRIQITQQELENLRTHLEASATHKSHHEQVDYYFDNSHNPFFYKTKQGDVDARNFLRVRKTPENAVLCLKKSYEDEKTRTPLYSDEYEVQVDDAQQAIALMEALGYTQKIIVKKIREAFAIDIFEVTIDQVDQLGLFVEIELKKSVESVEVGWQLINNWLKSVGINKFVLHKQGYIHMLMNPHMDVSKTITL